MAELLVRKKKKPILPLMILALLVVALATWFVLRKGDAESTEAAPAADTVTTTTVKPSYRDTIQSTTNPVTADTNKPAAPSPNQ